MDAAAIAAVLKDVLDSSKFAEETLDYMASILQEEPEAGDSEMWELLADFLRDAGVVAEDDEAAGLAICSQLVTRLRPGQAGGSTSSTAKAPAAAGKGSQGGGGYGGAKAEALSRPVMLSSLLEAAPQGSGAGFGDAYQVGDGPLGPRGGLEELPQEHLKVVAAVAKKKNEKIARRAERKAWRAEEMEEEDAVWVDLPAGQSLGGAGGAVDFHLERYNLVNKKGSGDLLCNASCTFAQGRRYGLLGRNGVGKSTFLDAVARREVPGVPSCSIFYVRQEVEGDERTAGEWLLQADSEKVRLNAEKEQLTGESSDGGIRLAQIYGRLEEIEGSEKHVEEKRASDILTGLGFDSVLRSKATRDLSGGWRMRVALACALFVSPGLLLLDEPTNHLDLETVIWLEHYINTGFHGTLLVVSHDRVFLNEVVTDIVLFENEALEVYRGDFNAFEKIREEHRARQERLREQQEMKREHLQEYITKHAEAGNNGCKAAAQRKARIRKLDKLGMEAQSAIEGRKIKLSYDGVQKDVEAVQDVASVTLTFPDPGVCDSLGNPLLRFTDLEFGYGDEPALFSGLNLSIGQDSRIAILGKNGSGKSTLLKLLLSKLRPRAGSSAPHRGACVEYVAQHHLENLDGESRPLQIALDRFPGDGSMTHELKMRMHLGHFGLGGDVLPHQKVKTLSGGQKFRVSLALAMYRKPHLLVMDEPTNHLDLETIDALVDALDEFKGGVILVSHDEHLIDSVCKDLYVLEKKKLNRFPGGIIEYKKRVLANSKLTS
ncbi:unnamed protein product [Polarella glacialis]|uniref:ABC transporter domain-containing protein n=1 Tax=Polarella glacialis TaxID=89957 RepID=A0A813KBS5_POLGL|nr:unnamed protein product [Polarella glacialis]